MKTGKKVLLSVSGAALLVAGSIAGTLAYLTSTEEVVNTFTIGKVDIDLTETAVNPDGTPKDGEDRVKKNKYHMVPGAEYTKDPMVTVKANSEEAYIRMVVTIKNWDEMNAFVDNDPTKLFTDLETADWTQQEITDFNVEPLVLEYRYKETVAGGKEDTDLSPLFETLSIPDNITSDDMADLESFEIVVQGHAIQSTGFTDADAAWTAFDAQESE